jgi:hypothetical protein
MRNQPVLSRERQSRFYRGTYRRRARQRDECGIIRFASVVKSDLLISKNPKRNAAPHLVLFLMNDSRSMSAWMSASAACS